MLKPSVKFLVKDFSVNGFAYLIHIYSYTLETSLMFAKQLKIFRILMIIKCSLAFDKVLHFSLATLNRLDFRLRDHL